MCKEEVNVMAISGFIDDKHLQQQIQSEQQLSKANFNRATMVSHALKGVEEGGRGGPGDGHREVVRRHRVGYLEHHNSDPFPSANVVASAANTNNNQQLTPYEKASIDVTHDARMVREVMLGKRIGFYRIWTELGRGNFSRVMLATHMLTKEKVAIKVLDKTRLDMRSQRMLSREIASMERLHHPNIVRLYEVIESLARLNLVMEYASGGELYHRISRTGRLQEPEARRLYAQIIAAVQHVHENGIVHRDIKAENIFFTSPTTVKLGDFGFSAFTTADQTLSTFCGSPPYAAPELFRDHSYLGPNVDVWAMGVLLFFITTALLPFRGETIAKLKKVIYEGAYTIPEHLSDDCQFLIRGILRGTPQDRFTLEEVRRSAWLAGEHFPPANSPYPMNPSLTPANAGSVASSDSGAGGGTGSAEPADMSNSVNGDNTADTTVGNKVTATSVVAAAARQRLVDEFGIRPEQLRRSQVDGPRNNVTGMFRIVMHQMDKRNNVGSLDDSCLPDSASGPAGVQQAYARAWNCQAGPALDGHRIATRRKQSKMCVIF